MPRTTAPPTYRSIPSRSPAASPSESALATSPRPRASAPSPAARKGGKLSCEVAVARARETAQLDRDPASDSGRALRPRIALTGAHAASQRLRPRGPRQASPARRTLRALRTRALRRGDPELPGAPGGCGQTFPQPTCRRGGWLLKPGMQRRAAGEVSRRPARCHQDRGARVSHRGTKGLRSAPLSPRPLCL